MIYEGVYKIIRSRGGWCVAKLAGHYDDGRARWMLVSNLYRYRGWAQAFVRRMKIPVQNYESEFA